MSGTKSAALFKSHWVPSLAGGLLLLGAVSSGASERYSQQSTGQAQQFNFNVLLDNKPIGYHEYSLKPDGDRLSIASQASFDVKLLFITAFRYRHSSQEYWQENCVSTLDAKTNNNGKQQDVQGQRQGDSFKLSSVMGPTEVGGCVQTFAYWNPHILEAESLLNTQTGEYVPIEVTPLGTEMLRLSNDEFAASKYQLRSATEFDGKPVEITLWYAKDTMQWLALESIAKGKRKLRYELDDARNVILNAVASAHAGN